MTTQTRLERIAAYVQERLVQMAVKYPSPEHDPVYRWQHTLRVAQFGVKLARLVNAQEELVAAACLLHDVAHFDPGDYKDHGRLAAEISQPFLQELGYSPEEVENIFYSIAAHADIENPETLEAKVVTDADNIDRFGAYRAILWVIDDLQDYEALIRKLTARVERLRDYRQRQVLATPEGNALFHEQLDLQIRFFEALIQEYAITRLPDLQ